MPARFIGLALVVFAGCEAAASAQSTQSAYVGAGSCSASACHNGLSRGSGSEYATWITRDPHARAYEALFLERSIRMQRNLGRRTAAHEDGHCLKCHVAPDYDLARPPREAPYFKTDGVSCESCHGSAKNWVEHHHRDGWRAKTVAEKKRLGMTDTRSVEGRAQVCVTCHVGAAGMDVDHDLIAAGHPRLHFEFAAFHASLPRHWPDARDRDPRASGRGRADFEARVWAVGQVAAAKAMLDLLAHRAEDRARPWPEFAEFDCASCHQTLRDGRATERKSRAFPWGDPLKISLLAPNDDPRARKLAAALAEIRGTMNSMAYPNRKETARQARQAADLLRPWLDDFPATDQAWLDRAMSSFLSQESRASDEATRKSLAVAALHRAGADMRLRLPTALRQSLTRFTRDLASVADFEPQAIRARVEALKAIANKDR